MPTRVRRSLEAAGVLSKRILVVKLSSLGDLFHALPAVHAVTSAMDASVDWVTQPEYARLVECFDDVDRVIAFPRRRFHADITGFLKALRTDRYDMVLDFQGLFKSALTARLARTTVRVGPVVRREGASLFYTVRPPPPKAGLPRDHAVAEALQVVRYLGIDADQPVFPVTFPAVTVVAEQPCIGLVPGSRWPSKNWPAACFQKLTVALVERVGGSIFLLGSEVDRPVCRRLAEACPDGTVHNLAGELDLVGLGSLMQTLDLVITNDTGPMHMAAALAVPVIALFGPTEARRTGPWGSLHQVLRAEVQPACAPCYQRQCQRRESTCLMGISVDTVLDAAQRSLNPRLSSK